MYPEDFVTYVPDRSHRSLQSLREPFGIEKARAMIDREEVGVLLPKFVDEPVAAQNNFSNRSIAQFGNDP